MKKDGTLALAMVTQDLTGQSGTGCAERQCAVTLAFPWDIDAKLLFSWTGRVSRRLCANGDGRASKCTRLDNHNPHSDVVSSRKAAARIGCWRRRFRKILALGPSSFLGISHGFGEVCQSPVLHRHALCLGQVQPADMAGRAGLVGSASHLAHVLEREARQVPLTSGFYSCT